MEKFLISMAMVKVNWDISQESPIDTYMPLLGYAISQCENDIVTVEEISKTLADVAELYVPQGALIVLLNRAAKRKYQYIKKENRVYLKNNSALQGLQFEEVRARASRSQNSLRIKFRSYCNDTLTKNITEEEIDNHFFEILYDISPHLAEHLWSAKGKPDEKEESLVEGTLRYYIYSFIEYTIKNDPEGYDAIDNFIRGAILTESFYYTLPQDITAKFRSVDVFLDTQLLIRALGWTDDSIARPCAELLVMLREAGVQIRCFRKTYDEIYGILTAAARAPRLRSLTPARPGDVFDFFSRKGITKADIELEIAKLDDSLKKIGVKNIVDFPMYATELGVDETKLNQLIDVEIFGQSEKAREHDVNCLTAIFRLRLGKIKTHIESCGAIFITTNSGLVRASTKFFNKEYGISDAPICMTDHIFSMLLWIKAAKKRPNLPKEQLVAIAYAATNPSDELWKKYLATAAEYMDRGNINENDYALLVHTLDARKYLMEMTDGDTDAFVQGTLNEILEKIKNGILLDTENKLKEESQYSFRMRRKVEKFINRAVGLTERVVQAAILSLIVIILVLCLLFSLSSQFYELFIASDKLVIRIIAPAFLALLSVATVLNLMFGTRLADLARKPANALGAFLRQVLTRQLLGG